MEETMGTLPLSESELATLWRETGRLLGDPELGDAAQLVRVSFAIGTRINELRHVRTCEVNCSDRTILVRQGKGKGAMGRRGAPAPRLVSWIPEFHQEMCDLVAQRILDDQEFLFPGTPGLFNYTWHQRPVSDREARRRFNEVMQAIGLPGSSSHTARKTFATWEAERLDHRDLAAQLGHSWKTCEKYYYQSIPGRRYQKDSEPAWRGEVATG
jgi:integrase